MAQARRAAPKAEAPLAKYMEKSATPFLAAYPEWLKDNVGINPASLDPEEAFAEGVRLSLAVHKQYQTSEENRKRTAEARAARLEAQAIRDKEREERAAAKALREDELATKRAARDAAKAEKAEKAKTKATTTSSPAKKAPVKKAPVAAKTPPVRRKAASSTDAPF